MPEAQVIEMAHLMRRAGFGASRDELEGYLANGYEATVEEMLHPETQPPALEDEDLVTRYHAGANSLMLLPSAQAYWLYRLINTKRPLEDKIGLFWHGLFATGYTKINNPEAILRQIDMFKRFGLGSFRDLLVELSKNPAMTIYLDNKDNHGEAVNENFGRELLELFSMGVGNYTEVDVRQASRAFTGWTLRNASLHSARIAQDSVEPYARLEWQFEYLPDDHDDGEKTFLGHTGDFNGEEIIDMICKHPATPRFIARHLYTFFVADEPQVPAWETVPPRDPQAIEAMAEAYFNSDYKIGSMLRVMFNSDWFKKSAFAKVKSPTELVVGASRTAGTYGFPEVDDISLSEVTGDMGQQLLDPPSVEGWHTGGEWIDTGTLVSRVNFASQQFADPNRPGVRSIINKLEALGKELSPEALVDGCLDLLGPIQVSQETREAMVSQAAQGGGVRFDSPEASRSSAGRITEVLQLIASTREYQLA